MLSDSTQLHTVCCTPYSINLFLKPLKNVIDILENRNQRNTASVIIHETNARYGIPITRYTFIPSSVFAFKLDVDGVFV